MPPASPTALVRLDKAGLTLSRTPILADIDFTLAPGASWAVLGPNGAGKTSFLRLARGEVWPSSGTRCYWVDGRASASPVGFRERTGRAGPDLARAYRRHAPLLAAAEAVRAGFYDALFPPAETGTPQAGARQAEAVAQALETVGLAHKAGDPVGSLSSGELARLLLARALVHEPVALFLDEAFSGVDTAQRREALAALERLLARDERPALVMAGHRAEDFPAVDRALWLEAGRVVRTGPFTPGASAHMPAADAAPFPVAATPVPEAPLELSGVDVVLVGRRVLRGVSWRVGPGERWAVTGPGGAGKSTLLALAAGELAPYATKGLLRRFGRQGAGAWDREFLQPRLGQVSDRLAHHYLEHQGDTTALAAVASGLFGQVGSHARPSADQWNRARDWLAAMGAEALADRPLRKLSDGQFRRVLLARALVHGPSLLLLDEPVAGLDAPSRTAFLERLEALLARTPGLACVHVSHHAADLTPAFTRRLILQDGLAEVVA